MLVTFATEGDMDRWLEIDAQRWDVYSEDLGVSLHAMRQLGHWFPVRTDGMIDVTVMHAARMIARRITPVQQHQQSRRVGPPSQEYRNAKRRLW